MFYGIDGLSESGSIKLADYIREYWSSRGYKVDVRIDYASAKDHRIYCVRSNLVNGAPPDFKEKKVDKPKNKKPKKLRRVRGVWKLGGHYVKGAANAT